MEQAQHDAIAAAVRARMQSFEAAERARDAEGLLAHNAAPPDFRIYHDGRPGTYAALQLGVRGGLPALRSLDVTYGDLQIAVLSAEYALLSATFRREMVIAASGAKPTSARVPYRTCGGTSTASG